MNATNDSNYKWTVLGIVMVGTLMSSLDASIVNVALPKMMADFGASVDDIEWVITGYMLSFATLMPLTGWLREQVGPKVLYTSALVVFTIGSVLCGFAWNLPTLIFSRVIQAFGGGALIPIGMAMISDAFKPHERGKALGYWGVGAIMGPAIGPTLGGYLTLHLGWRSIFLVNLPVGVAGAIWAMASLRGDKPAAHMKKPFDFIGFTFLSTFLIAFLLGLSKGEKEGWMSTYIVTCWVLAAIGFTGFITTAFIVPHPVLNLRLFKYKIFTAAAIVTFGRSIALYGGTFLLPLFIQQLMGRDEIDSGLILLPGALLIGFVMPQSAKVNEILGPRLTCLVGLFLVGLSMFQYRTIDLNSSIFMGLIFPTLFRGLGIGLLVAPVMASAMNAVPPDSTAAASSMLNLLQQVAGSVGIGVLSTMLTTRTKFHMQIMGAVDPNSSATSEALRGLYYQAHDLGYNTMESAQVAQGLLIKHVSTMSRVAGFEDAFIIGGIAVGLGFVAAFLMPTKASHVDAEHLVME